MKKLLILTLSLFLLISLSAMAQEDDQEFQNQQAEAQRLIDEAGGQWYVGDSDIARMPEEDFQKLLGVLEDPNPPEFYGIESLQVSEAAAAALPRSYSLKSYMTPVKRQRCGDCWAFAACGALEGTLRKSTGRSYDLSEQLLVSSCCSAGSCSGGWPRLTASFIENTGVPEESCYPYRGSDSLCSEACYNWRQIAIRAKTYSVSQSVNAIKSAIYYYGPVNLAFRVYSDFQRYGGGIYSWNGTAKFKSGHAVVAVGWSDYNGGYFIAKNSWGTGWGEGGYFRIAYSQVNNSVEFGMQANVFSK